MRVLLPLAFLSLLAASAFVRARAASAPLPTAPPAEPGTFPEQWINGVDCASEPPIQVHAYNANLYILRQSKCTHFEAPFLYLIFGRDRALLIDTGSYGSPPLAATVDRVVQEWLAANGRSRIDLVVAHSHAHGDHVQGDAQMAALPYARVVGTSLVDVIDFFGFGGPDPWFTTFDLGGRVLDVIRTPGHHSTGITFYDRRTQLLLTGDIVYPGHLFVFSPAAWPEFVGSIRRLVEFARANPVSWVLGCHIEMSGPGACLPWGTPAHPAEHVLQLEPRVLLDVLRSARNMGDDPFCGDVREHFIIHPVWICPINQGC